MKMMQEIPREMSKFRLRITIKISERKRNRIKKSNRNIYVTQRITKQRNINAIISKKPMAHREAIRSKKTTIKIQRDPSTIHLF